MATVPNAKTIRDMAIYFNVSSDYLLGLSNQQNKINNKETELFSSEITQDFYTLSKNQNIKNTFKKLIHQEEFINFIQYIDLYLTYMNDSNKVDFKFSFKDEITLSEIYKMKLYNTFDTILNKINKQNLKALKSSQI